MERETDKYKKVKNTYMKKYRNLPGMREKHRKYMMEWRKKNKEKLNNYRKIFMGKYRQTSTEKIKNKARQLANKIQIPTEKLCEVCDKNKAIERHHKDYDKPEDVLLVCRLCHSDIHLNTCKEVIEI